tara:strand:+ start:4893 stop:5369 length:477 start_codon:yes stop_codon:yes gene_type:complete
MKRQEPEPKNSLDTDFFLPNHSGLRNNTDNYQLIGTVPIGAVIMWHKSLTGVPSLPGNYVECNGQVLNDSLSPLNGQTMPNINNTSIVAGFTSSGITGGSATHTHTGTTNFENEDECIACTRGEEISVVQCQHVHTFTTGAALNAPVFVTMVFVIRTR